MFSAKTYTARRHELRTKIGSGIILLPGNSLSPNNYPNNAYYFRQDSSFRYYFGLNVPSVVGVIDADTGEEALYGDDFTVEDIIWTGPQPTLREMGAGAGVTATFPMAELEKRLRRAISLGRRVHYLPPYRGETKLQLSALLGIKPALLHDYKSVDLMFAVAEMREKKSAEEVEEMERAFRIGYEMHTTAMRMCRPGVVERQIAGAIEGVAKSRGQGVSFPSIVSQHGETLHNLNADGVLKEGRLLLCDAGGETVEGYCSDHTRTYPVSGRFTQKQKDIYNIVLAAHDHVARIVKPHMMYTEVHNAAYMTLAEGLVGLGHGLGMDVHDCEAMPIWPASCATPPLPPWSVWWPCARRSDPTSLFWPETSTTMRTSVCAPKLPCATPASAWGVWVFPFFWPTATTIPCPPGSALCAGRTT